MATTITPGGRIGNDASRGSRTNGENWVEEVGGLPRYIRIVRNGLMKKRGMTEGRATAFAVAAMKRWARGGDNVSPKVQAAAAKALAEWEAKKKLARATKNDDDTFMESKESGVAPAAQKRPPRGKGNWDEDDESKHPRGKAGSGKGGQFVAKGSSESNGGKPGKGDDDKFTGPEDPDKYDLSDIGDVRELMRSWRTVPMGTRAALKERIKKRLDKEDGHERLRALADGLGDGDGKREAGEGSGRAMNEGRADEWIEDQEERSEAARDYVAKKRGAKKTASAKPGKGPDEKDGGVPTHKIKRGDTLSALAEEWGVTVEQIAEYNDIEDPDVIYAGDTIKRPPKPAKKAATAKKSTPGRKSLFDVEVSDAEFKALVPDTVLQELHDDIDTTVETKEAKMGMEFKTVGVVGQQVEDPENGIVNTIVSVTGLRDNVKDVIHPGAYEKTLKTRIPKGVWSHSWDTPVSKTLDVKELLPGDPALPKKLPNGEPWPKGAGAVQVKTQFNLDTQRGREAYSDVVFFGDQQEWSIGYQVPMGGARIDSKTGVRHIDYLEWYEYSPVLFGAMSAARTQNPAMAGAGVKSYVEFDSVKDAQAAYRSVTMSDTEFKAWADEMGVEWKHDLSGVIEVKGGPRADDAEEEEDDESTVEPDETDAGSDADDADDDSEDWADDEEDDEEEKSLTLGSPTAYEYELLYKTRAAIDAVLDAADYEAEAASGVAEEKTLVAIIERNSDALGEFAEEMKDAAEAFDTAYDLEDVDGMNDFGNDVLEVLEKALEDAEAEDNRALTGALHKVAAAVAAMAPVDEEDMDSPEDESDEDDMQTKPRPIPPRPGTKPVDEDEVEDEEKSLVVMDTKELAHMRVAIEHMLKR